MISPIELENYGYEARMNYLKANVDLAYLEYLVYWWLIDRPGIRENNSDIENVKLHALNEISEVGRALNEGQNIYEEPQLEVVDTSWLVKAIAITHGIQLDYYDIKSRANGHGKRDDILEVLAKAIEDVNEKELKKTLERFFSIWMSVLAAMPDFKHPRALMNQVARKDYHNYPAEAFPKKNPFTGEALTEEQRQPFFRFDNPRRFLRLIRDFQVVMLGKGRATGMLTSDYEVYMDDYINAHFKKGVNDAKKIADQAYLALQQVLLQVHKDEILIDIQIELMNFSGSLADYLELKKNPERRIKLIEAKSIVVPNGQIIQVVT